jgi:hypothetical protein
VCLFCFSISHCPQLLPPASLPHVAKAKSLLRNKTLPSQPLAFREFDFLCVVRFPVPALSLTGDPCDTQSPWGSFECLKKRLLVKRELMYYLYRFKNHND